MRMCRFVSIAVVSSTIFCCSFLMILHLILSFQGGLVAFFQTGLLKVPPSFKTGHSVRNHRHGTAEDNVGRWRSCTQTALKHKPLRIGRTCARMGEISSVSVDSQSDVFVRKERVWRKH